MSKLLWNPSEERIKKTNMYRFMGFINQRYGQNFNGYEPLYQWSIENISDFWSAMWEFADIKASKPYDQVIDDVTKLPGPSGFQGPGLISRKTFCASGTIASPWSSRGRSRIPSR